ncbi:hypothetical protein BDV96DRAFT_591305 [Lophiotrema nucula]|uniref:Uncharacterized protein n=1 Tax=Lophiotrema nucula TaxID=690887 RepID=A0A6A5YGJ3_9PLEO|nr:hypothetical protein BDV96DRAFT_591305 [Lophiotrema nucula]
MRFLRYSVGTAIAIILLGALLELFLIAHPLHNSRYEDLGQADTLPIPSLPIPNSPLLASPDSFRTLILLLGKASQPIRYELVSTKISDSAFYEALSYQ